MRLVLTTDIYIKRFCARLGRKYQKCFKALVRKGKKKATSFSVTSLASILLLKGLNACHYEELVV